MSSSNTPTVPLGQEQTIGQLMASNRIEELLDEWTPVAHKLMPAGAPASQLSAYTYSLLEGLATAAAMPDRQRAAFLNAYRARSKGQPDTVQTLIDRLPADSPEGQRLSLLLSPKASDQRRCLCLAAALELRGDGQLGGAASPADQSIPPFAVFGLQLWTEGFSYGQFIEALKAHRKRCAPKAEAEIDAAPIRNNSAADGGRPNLVHHFYRWVLERDGRWRRGEYSVVLNSRGATLQLKGQPLKHYEDSLKAVAECDRKAKEAGAARSHDKVDMMEWLVSLNMPEPDRVIWEGLSTAAYEGSALEPGRRVAFIQHRGHTYALSRNRLTSTLTLCAMEGDQLGPVLATSEAPLEINWWMRKDEIGRKAIVAWMLKEAKL